MLPPIFGGGIALQSTSSIGASNDCILPISSSAYTIRIVDITASYAPIAQDYQNPTAGAFGTRSVLGRLSVIRGPKIDPAKIFSSGPPNPALYNPWPNGIGDVLFDVPITDLGAHQFRFSEHGGQGSLEASANNWLNVILLTPQSYQNNGTVQLNAVGALHVHTLQFNTDDAFTVAGVKLK